MARPGLEPGPTTARASRRRLAKCCQDNQLTNAASPACWQHDACEGRRTRCVCCPSYRNSAEAWRSLAPCACAAGGSSSVRIAPSCSARGAQSRTRDPHRRDAAEWTPPHETQRSAVAVGGRRKGWRLGADEEPSGAVGALCRRCHPTTMSRTSATCPRPDWNHIGTTGAGAPQRRRPPLRAAFVLSRPQQSFLRRLRWSASIAGAGFVSGSDTRIRQQYRATA